MRKGTKEILDLVEDNILTARKSVEAGLYRSACFWAQQAIELALKAFLAENNVFDIYRHRTHNLRFLIEECRKIDDSFRYLLEFGDINRVSSYAVQTRYNVLFAREVSREEAKEALELAEKVREFVLGKLNIDENRK